MSKKYYEFKLAHGWYGGGCKETDVICTIDSGIHMWHTLILEVEEDGREADRNRWDARTSKHKE